MNILINMKKVIRNNFKTGYAFVCFSTSKPLLCLTFIFYKVLRIDLVLLKYDEYGRVGDIVNTTIIEVVFCSIS